MAWSPLSKGHNTDAFANFASLARGADTKTHNMQLALHPVVVPVGAQSQTYPFCWARLGPLGMLGMAIV
jgi:hypothetical protein